MHGQQNIKKCEIQCFNSFVVLLVSRYENFEPANQQNILKDQYPDSRHSYLLYPVLHAYVLYCDTGTCTCFVLCQLDKRKKNFKTLPYGIQSCHTLLNTLILG